MWTDSFEGWFACLGLLSNIDKKVSYTYIGANIYCWGEKDQQRLVLEGLRSWAIEFRESDLSRFFWYCRFDARGPHVFTIFGSRAEQSAALQTALTGKITSYLETYSSEELPIKEIERRHRECRGKTLCFADELAGLASNNSFEIFEHGPDGYPLGLASGLPAPELFWKQIGAIPYWALAQIERGTAQPAAVRFVCELNRCLENAGIPTGPYWRLHASTLIPALIDRHDSESIETPSFFEKVLGERNRKALSRMWRQDWDTSKDFDLDGVVKNISSASGLTPEQRLHKLREIAHLTFQQLGQPVRTHIPLVVYAWQASLT